MLNAFMMFCLEEVDGVVCCCCAGPPPSEICPPAFCVLSPSDRPIKSFSSDESVCAPIFAPAGAPDVGADELSAGPKSMSDSSFPGPLDTPAPLLPSVPLGIRDAAATSPVLTSLYRSIVLCMLSLISNSFATASWSSDSSSHIFWIFGCALANAFDSS